MGISQVQLRLFFLFLLYGYGQIAHAQVAVSVSQPGLGEMEVCVDSATFSFRIGPFSSNLTNVEIQVELPPGIYYVDNSLTNLADADLPLTLINYSGQTIRLAGGNTGSGQSFSFSLDLFAGCDALPDFLSGQAFSNTVSVYENNNLYETLNSPQYNSAIDYGELSMSTGASPSGAVGQIVTREIEVFSSGSGCITSLNWYDAYGTDIRADSLYFQGQKLNTWTNGDTLFYDFTGLDFMGFGDGDAEFCQADGPIILTEYIQILGCSDKSSYISAGWGCQGVFCSDFDLSADVVVNNLQPSLTFEARPDTLSGCFYNQPNRKELVIRNVGAGSLVNMELEIKKNYYGGQFPENKYDGLDSSSVEVRYNDGPFQSISPRNVESNIYGNSCSLPLAYRFFIDIDFLIPGDSIVVAFDMINCVPDLCGEAEIRQGAWGYNCRYDLPCASSNVVIANQVGGLPGILKHQVSNFDPPSLVSGKEATFTTTMEQSEINFPDGGAYLVRYTLPNCGTSFSGNSADFIWNNIGGDLAWPNKNFSYSANQVEAQFDLSDIPPNFIVNGSEIKLNLLGDCSCPASDSIQFLQKEILYLATPTCSPQAEIVVFCDTVSFLVDPCMTTTCNGMQIMDFEFNRSNLDAPDTDLNRVPDVGNTYSPEVRRNRARLGDTIQAKLTGYVNGAGSFIFGYADLTVEFSQYLTPLAGNLRFFDQSTGLTHTCNSVLPVRVGTSDIFRVDYSPLTVAGTCPLFGGLNLETGDSVLLDLQFIVSAVHSSKIEVGAIFPVEMYMSNVPNPAEADKFTCRGTQFSALMQLVPMVDTSFVTQISAHSCQQTQARTYINMFTGGSYTDMFPYEYRAWSFPDTLLVTPPADYNYVGANILLRFSPYIKVLNVAPVDPSANPLIFDLKALVDNGSLIYPDDGYELQFFTSWLPECEAVSNQQVDVPVEGRFRWAQGLTAYDTPKNYLPSIRHNTPDISLNNQSAATQDGLKTEVGWDMELSNTSVSSNSPYTWLAFYSPSGDVQVVEIRDNNGNPVSQSNGIYELGLLNKSTTRGFSIDAQYDQCNLDTLIVYAGWECAGYPTSLENACQTDSFYLFIDPNPADGQITLTTSVKDTVALFEPISYNFSILSTQIANLNNLILEIFHTNQGLDFIPGSAELEYPLGSGFRNIADPQLVAGAYQFVMANHDATLSAEGLAGLGSSTAPYRQFNIRFDLAPNCNFVSGETWLLNLLANMPCGDPLSIQRIIEPIFIKGGITPYETKITAKLNQVYSCNNYQLRVSMQPSDSTGASDSLSVFIPEAYTYDSSLYQSIRHPFSISNPLSDTANGGAWYTWPMDSGIVGGDSLVFLMGLKKELSNSCPGGTEIPIVIKTTYQFPGNCQSGAATAGQTGIDTSNIEINDSFIPQISLSYPGANPRMASQDSQLWDLTLSHMNGTYAAAYPWMRVVSLSGNTIPLSLRDKATNTSFPSNSGFWQIDSLDIATNLQLELEALVSLCGPDTLYLYYGYGCESYPTDPLSIPCGYDSLLLVVQPSLPYIDLSARLVQDPSCFQSTDGRILLDVSGGQQPYEFARGANAFSAQDDFLDLSAGSYRFYVRDSSACMDSLEIVLAQPLPLVLSVDSLRHINCGGDTTGEIHLSASGATGPYQYALNQGPWGSDSSFYQLAGGIYIVRIKDSQNCEDSTMLSLSEANPIQSLMQVDQTITCYGGSNGSISVSTSGGNGALSYNWQGLSGNSNTQNNLAEGQYVVEISDTDGCISTDSIRLSEPPPLISSLNMMQEITCPDASDARVEALVTGGSSGYIYTWSAGSSLGAQVENVPEGMLYLEISDANACTKQDSIFVLAPPPLVLTLTGEHVTCFGENTGSVAVAVEGGNAPYAYEWNNTPNLSSSSLSNRISGNYHVKVTDQMGCSDTSSFQISQPLPMLVDIVAVDETCADKNGSLQARIEGGTAPYQYLWSNQASTPEIMGLSAATYSLQVRDANGCIQTESAVVAQGTFVQLEMVAQQAASCGQPNGIAEVRASGGTGDISYTWNSNPIQYGPKAINLYGDDTGSSYWVEAIDSAGCTDSLEVFVESTARPKAQFLTLPKVVQPIFRSEAHIYFVNQSQNSNAYFWDFGEAGAFSNKTNPSYTYEKAGTYRVMLTAMDAVTICPDTAVLDIVVIEDGKIFTANAFSPNNDGDNDVFYAYGEGIQTFEMLIFDRFGNLLKKCEHIGEGWDGKGPGGKLAPEGVYTYTLKALLQDGTHMERGGTITLFR